MHGLSLILFVITCNAVNAMCIGITIRLWFLAQKGLRDSRRYTAAVDKAHQLQLYREMDHFGCRADNRRVWCIFGSPYCPWKPVMPRDIAKN